MYTPSSRHSWLLGLMLLVASPAAAQDWDQPWADPLDRPGRVDVSVSLGYQMATDWSELVLLGTVSPAFGVLEQVLVQDLRVQPDVEYAGAVTYWRARYGVRAEVARSRSTLAIGGAALGIDGRPVNVKSWLYGLRGLVGLLEYHPQRRVWPYAFLGFGAATYDLAQPVSPPLLTFIQRPGNVSGESDIVVVGDGREFVVQVNELDLETTPALTIGAGADLRLPLGPAGVGLRLEVADHVARSPLRLQIRELGRHVADSPVRFGRVHHLRASAGIIVTLGR